MIAAIGPKEYDELCRRVRQVVRDATPPEAVVAVVSKGDPRLVEIEGRTGLHFPSDGDGNYAGYHPKTSEDALEHVESLVRGGAQFLCIPASAIWWLEHYHRLAAWLSTHCRVTANDPTTCVVYDLLAPPGPTASTTEPSAMIDAQVRSLLDALLPEGALLLVIGGSFGGLSAPGRVVRTVDSLQALQQSSGTPGTSPPTFILVARGESTEPLDPDLESFLGCQTELVAHREHLCDLLQMGNARTLGLD